MAITISFGQNTKDWVDILAAFAPLFVGIGSILIAIIANCLTIKNLKQQTRRFAIQLKEERRNLNKQLNMQKEQWLNDSYIKQEATIILKFRELILNSQNSFYFFTHLFQPYLIRNKMFPEQDVYLKQEDLYVKFNEFCIHYDRLHKIHEFYNLNQMFIHKNNIKSEMDCVIAILGAYVHLAACDDFKYKFLYEDDKCVKYALNKNKGILSSFIFRMKNFKLEEDVPDFKYSDEELKFYADSILASYFQIKQKLDEIVTFYDNDLQKDTVRSEFYFPNIDELKNNISKKGGVKNDL